MYNSNEMVRNCQVLVKNLNFVAGMTRRFVSAKRLIRYFSNSSKLVEHRAQSPVREVKMLAVWPSIAEGFPTAKFTSYMRNGKNTDICKSSSHKRMIMIMMRRIEGG